MPNLKEWPRLDDFTEHMPVAVPALSEMAWVVPCSQCGELLVGPRRDGVPEADYPLMEQLVCMQCTYGVQHITPELIEMMMGSEVQNLEMSEEKYVDAKQLMVTSGIMTEHDFYVMIAKLIGGGVKVSVPNEDKISIMKVMIEIIDSLESQND